MVSRFSGLRWFLPLVGMLVVISLFGARPALAAGVVGNGTPGTCNETNFMNALNGGGTVTFNCGAVPKTITINAIKNISLSTKIDGGNKITLKAVNTNHFQVSVSATLTLVNITLSNGKASSAGAIENFGTLKATHVTFSNNNSTANGGAINNYGTVVVKSSTFSGNQSAGEGGAIYNQSGATVTVKKSAFTSNKTTAASYGGGAINNDSGTLTVKSSTFTSNTSNSSGGAILNSDIASVTASTFNTNTATAGGGAIMNLNGTLTLTTSTLNANQAAYGGGLVLYGANNNITRSTFSNNTAASDGGGIYSDSDTTFTNITVSGNHAGAVSNGGGGLFQKNGTSFLDYSTIANNTSFYGGGVTKDGTGILSVENVVLSQNTGGNCAGSLNSVGHNLSSDTYCGDFFATGDMNHKNAKLGALANNGGPTKTHLPLSGSPLISKGTPIGGVTTDQRGDPRPQGAQVDIGSVEVN